MGQKYSPKSLSHLSHLCDTWLKRQRAYTIIILSVQMHGEFNTGIYTSQVRWRCKEIKHKTKPRLKPRFQKQTLEYMRKWRCDNLGGKTKIVLTYITLNRGMPLESFWCFPPIVVLDFKGRTRQCQQNNEWKTIVKIGTSIPLINHSHNTAFMYCFNLLPSSCDTHLKFGLDCQIVYGAS